MNTQGKKISDIGYFTVEGETLSEWLWRIWRTPSVSRSTSASLQSSVSLQTSVKK